MYSSEDKKKAIALRLSGKSYGEIQKIMHIPSKGTLSVWFRKLVLTPKQKELLSSNIDKATRRKLIAFNVERTKRIKTENLNAKAQGRARIGAISKRDLLIIGAALYWGEGTKSEAGRAYNPVAFSNSDPEMVRVFLRFLREILVVPDDRIGGGINIYANIDEQEARTFWSKCTDLPPDRFYISYQVSRAGKGIRKTLPFGTISIRINNRLLFQNIKGMIEGLAVG
jgi:hypothetical protein